MRLTDRLMRMGRGLSLIGARPVSVPTNVPRSGPRGAPLGKADVYEPISLPVSTVTTAAGQSVTVNTALTLSTIWACGRLLGETVGTMPLKLLRRGTDGSWETADDDLLYDLLHTAPNADLSASEFWEGMVLSVAMRGNAYARKERLGSRVVALTPLAADRMQVKRNPAGRREYWYSDARTGRKVWDEDDILHIRGFGPAGDVGLSPIDFARQSISTSLATEQMAGSAFASGARFGGVLNTGQVLTPDQRKQLRENVIGPFAGSSAATGGVLVLEGDMKFQAVAMTLENAQFLESRAFQVEELCRWFRVPPFMIGHTEKSTSWGTGLEQQMIGFLKFALQPYLTRIEQAVSRSLIPAERRREMKAEFVVEGLLRSDSMARAQYLEIMVRNGLMTRNEARRKDNLPPLPGGDVLTVQAQNVPVGQAAGASGNTQEGGL